MLTGFLDIKNREVRRALTALVAEQLRAGVPFRTTALSKSMAPLIRLGNQVSLAWKEPTRIVPGDVIAVATDQGFRIHRVRRVVRGDGGPSFVTQGDLSALPDGTFAPEELHPESSPPSKETRRPFASIVGLAESVAGWRTGRPVRRGCGTATKYGPGITSCVPPPLRCCPRSTARTTGWRLPARGSSLSLWATKFPCAEAWRGGEAATGAKRHRSLLAHSPAIGPSDPPIVDRLPKHEEVVSRTGRNVRHRCRRLEFLDSLRRTRNGEPFLETGLHRQRLRIARGEVSARSLCARRARHCPALFATVVALPRTGAAAPRSSPSAAGSHRHSRLRSVCRSPTR